MGIGFAIMAGFTSMGVSVDKIDKETNTVYFSLPKESCDYNKGNIKNAEDLANSIKEKFIDAGYFGENAKMKYRISDMVWTEEKRNQAIKEFKKEYIFK